MIFAEATRIKLLHTCINRQRNLFNDSIKYIRTRYNEKKKEKERQ